MRQPLRAAFIVLGGLAVLAGCSRDPGPPMPPPEAPPRADAPVTPERSRADQPLPAPAVMPAGIGDAVAGAGLPKPGGGAFTDVTEAAGLRFVHSFGDRHFSNLAEAVGGGAVFFDFDADGWLDLYLTTGKWVDGISKGDRPPTNPMNRLYRNRRDGTFDDVTERAGVAAAGLFSSGASAGDYDGDGHLDLYVVNYVEFVSDYNLFYAPDGFPGPLAYKGQPDRLYRNRGDGTFEDVSEAAGVARFAGRGMSAAAGDIDGDGHDDIYVTNDQMENYLFRNDGNGRFTEIGALSFAAYNGGGDSTASMGIDMGDIDADGRLDLFVSDEALSSLYRNEGDGTFTDTVFESGIARSSAQYVGWGSLLFDFDNDGDLDLLKVNSDLSRLFGQEDQVYENIGNGRFEDVSERMGGHFRLALRGRGAAFGDYDNDGDLDVVINNLHGPPVLLRNDVGSRHNWLQVQLVGHRSNRDGIGARLELHAGGQPQVRFRRSASGYLSQSDPRVHVGIGRAELVDRLEILWPSGVRQVLERVPVNQLLTVHEPAGASMTRRSDDGGRR